MKALSRVALALVASTAALHCAVTTGGPDGTTPGEVETGAPEASSDGPSSGGDAAPDVSPSGDAASRTPCSVDHWCKTTLPSKDFDLVAVWSFAPDDALAVGPSGMVRWDGKTWSLVPVSTDAGLAGLTGLWASGTNDLWAVGNDRRLVHGVRAGAGKDFTFHTYDRASGPTRMFVTGTGPNDVWTGGFEDDGTPKLEHVVVGDGGVPSSTFLSIGIAGFSMNALFVTPAGELWLAGSVDNAIVAHGKKVGANYAWDTSLTTAGQMFTVFSDIFGPATNELWVMGARGESYHRSPLADGGASWTKLMTNATVTMSRVWGASKDDVWAIGYFGAIRHFDGSAWSVSQVSVDGVPDYAPLFGIHGSAANDVWAVGTGVALHRSTP